MDKERVDGAMMADGNQDQEVDGVGFYEYVQSQSSRESYGVNSNIGYTLAVIMTSMSATFIYWIVLMSGGSSVQAFVSVLVMGITSVIVFFSIDAIIEYIVGAALQRLLLQTIDRPNGEIDATMARKAAYEAINVVSNVSKGQFLITIRGFCIHQSLLRSLDLKYPPFSWEKLCIESVSLRVTSTSRQPSIYRYDRENTDAFNIKKYMQNAINLYLPIIDISLGFHGISANLKMQSDHARVTSQDIQQHQELLLNKANELIVEALFGNENEKVPDRTAQLISTSTQFISSFEVSLRNILFTYNHAGAAPCTYEMKVDSIILSSFAQTSQVSASHVISKEDWKTEKGGDWNSRVANTIRVVGLTVEVFLRHAECVPQESSQYCIVRRWGATCHVDVDTKMKWGQDIDNLIKRKFQPRIEGRHAALGLIEKISSVPLMTIKMSANSLTLSLCHQSIKTINRTLEDWQRYAELDSVRKTRPSFAIRYCPEAWWQWAANSIISITKGCCPISTRSDIGLMSKSKRNVSHANSEASLAYRWIVNFNTQGTRLRRRYRNDYIALYSKKLWVEHTYASILSWLRPGHHKLLLSELASIECQLEFQDILLFRTMALLASPSLNRKLKSNMYRLRSKSQKLRKSSWFDFRRPQQDKDENLPHISVTKMYNTLLEAIQGFSFPVDILLEQFCIPVSTIELRLCETSSLNLRVDGLEIGVASKGTSRYIAWTTIGTLSIVERLQDPKKDDIDESILLAGDASKPFINVLLSCFDRKATSPILLFHRKVESYMDISFSPIRILLSPMQISRLALYADQVSVMEDSVDEEIELKRSDSYNYSKALAKLSDLVDVNPIPVVGERNEDLNTYLTAPSILVGIRGVTASEIITTTTAVGVFEISEISWCEFDGEDNPFCPEMHVYIDRNSEGVKGTKLWRYPNLYLRRVNYSSHFLGMQAVAYILRDRNKVLNVENLHQLVAEFKAKDWQPNEYIIDPFRLQLSSATRSLLLNRSFAHLHIRTSGIRIRISPSTLNLAANISQSLSIPRTNSNNKSSSASNYKPVKSNVNGDSKQHETSSWTESNLLAEIPVLSVMLSSTSTDPHHMSEYFEFSAYLIEFQSSSKISGGSEHGGGKPDSSKYNLTRELLNRCLFESKEWQVMTAVDELISVSVRDIFLHGSGRGNPTGVFEMFSLRPFEQSPMKANGHSEAASHYQNRDGSVPEQGTYRSNGEIGVVDACVLSQPNMMSPDEWGQSLYNLAAENGMRGEVALQFSSRTFALCTSSTLNCAKFCAILNLDPLLGLVSESKFVDPLKLLVQNSGNTVVGKSSDANTHGNETSDIESRVDGTSTFSIIIGMIQVKLIPSRVLQFGQSLTTSLASENVMPEQSMRLGFGGIRVELCNRNLLSSLTATCVSFNIDETISMSERPKKLGESTGGDWQNDTTQSSPTGASAELRSLRIRRIVDIRSNDVNQIALALSSTTQLSSAMDDKQATTMDIHVYGISRVIYIKPAFDFLAAFVEKIQNEAQTLVEPFTGEKEIADEDQGTSASTCDDCPPPPLFMYIRLNGFNLTVPRSPAEARCDILIVRSNKVFLTNKSIPAWFDDASSVCSSTGKEIISVYLAEVTMCLRDKLMGEEKTLLVSPSVEGTLDFNKDSYIHFSISSLNVFMSTQAYSSFMGVIFEHYFKTTDQPLNPSTTSSEIVLNEKNEEKSFSHIKIKVCNVRASIDGWVEGLPESNILLQASDLLIHVLSIENHNEAENLMSIKTASKTLLIQQQPTKSYVESDKMFGKVNLIDLYNSSKDGPLWEVNDHSHPFQVDHRLYLNGNQETDIKILNVNSVWPTMLDLTPLWGLISVFTSYFSSEEYLEVLKDDTSGSARSEDVEQTVDGESIVSVDLNNVNLFFPCGGRKAGGIGSEDGWRYGVNLKAGRLSLKYAWNISGSSSYLNACLEDLHGKAKQDDEVARILSHNTKSLRGNTILYEHRLSNTIEITDYLSISGLVLEMPVSAVPVIRMFSEKLTESLQTDEDIESADSVSSDDITVSSEKKAHYVSRSKEMLLRSDTNVLSYSLSDSISGSETRHSELGKILETDDSSDIVESTDASQDLTQEAIVEGLVTALIQDIVAKSEGERIEECEIFEHTFIDNTTQSSNIGESDVEQINELDLESLTDDGDVQTTEETPFKYCIRYIFDDIYVVLLDDVKNRRTVKKGASGSFNEYDSKMPILKVSLQSLSGDYISAASCVADVEVSMKLGLDYFNNEIERFEYLIESWGMVGRYVQRESATITISSDERMSIVFTPSQIRCLYRLPAFMEAWEAELGTYVGTGKKRWKQALSRSILDIKKHPGISLTQSSSREASTGYIVRNDTGIRVWFWLHGTNATMLGAGREKAITMQKGKDESHSNSKSDAIIHLQLDGGWKPLKIIGLKRVGRYAVTAETLMGDIRVPLIVEVLRRGRDHVLSMHSCLRVVNETQRHIDFRFLDFDEDLSACKVPSLFGPVLAGGGSQYLPLPTVLKATMAVRAVGYEHCLYKPIQLSLNIKELISLQDIFSCSPPHESGDSSSSFSKAFHMTLQVVEFSRVLFLGENNASSQGMYDLIFTCPLIIHNLLPNPYSLEFSIGLDEDSETLISDEIEERLRSTARHDDISRAMSTRSGTLSSKTARHTRGATFGDAGSRRNGTMSRSFATNRSRRDLGETQRSEASNLSTMNTFRKKFVDIVSAAGGGTQDSTSTRKQPSSRGKIIMQSNGDSIESGKSHHVYFVNTRAAPIHLSLRIHGEGRNVSDESSVSATAKSLHVFDFRGDMFSTAKPRKVNLWYESGITSSAHSNGRKVTLLVETKAIRGGSLSGSMSIFSPYLVYNLTPTSIFLRGSGFGNAMSSNTVVESPSMRMQGNGRWTPQSATLFYCSRKKVRLRTLDSDWSRNVDLSKVGLDGTLRLEGGYTSNDISHSLDEDSPAKKLRNSRSRQNFYQHILGITLRYGPSEMRRSELIIISPAFILSNRSGRVLEIKQVTSGQHDAGVSGKLNDNDVMPLMSTMYKTGDSNDKSGSNLEFVVRYREVRLRLDNLLETNEEDQDNSIEEAWWQFSHPFRINEAGEQILRMRGVEDDLETVHLIPVYIMVKGASTIVIFGKEEDAIAPYRIENKSANVTLHVVQKGVEDSAYESIPPNASLDYAWDAPLKPHRLKVCLEHKILQGVYFSRIIKEYNIDEIQSRPTIKFKTGAESQSVTGSVRRKISRPGEKNTNVDSRAQDASLGEELHVQIRAEGPFRVLSFTTAKQNEKLTKEIVVAKRRLRELERKIAAIDMLIESVDVDELTEMEARSIISSRVPSTEINTARSSSLSDDFDVSVPPPTFKVTPAAAMLRSAKSYLSQRSVTKFETVRSMRSEISIDELSPRLGKTGFTESAAGGELAVQLVKGSDIGIHNDVDNLFLYCTISFDGQVRISPALASTTDPEWEYRCIFSGVGEEANLTFEVYSQSDGEDQYFGMAQITIDDDDVDGEERILSLENIKSRERHSGTITIALSWSKTLQEQLAISIKTKEQELAVKEHILNIVDEELSQMPNQDRMLPSLQRNESNDKVSHPKALDAQDDTNEIRTWDEIADSRLRKGIESGQQNLKVDVRIISARNLRSKVKKGTGLYVRYSIQETAKQKAVRRKASSLSLNDSASQKSKSKDSVPSRTSVIRGANDPEWNEGNIFHTNTAKVELKIDVVERNVRLGDTTIGTANLVLESIAVNNHPQFFWLPLARSHHINSRLGKLKNTLLLADYINTEKNDDLNQESVGDIRVRLEIVPEVEYEDPQQADTLVGSTQSSTIKMNVDLHGIGIGLQDLWDRDLEVTELLHIYFGGVHVEWENGAGDGSEDVAVRILVTQMQVDNMLANAEFPVMMSQTVNNDTDGDLAALELAWLRTSNELSRHHFRYLSVLLQEADIHVEENLLDRISKFQEDIQSELRRWAEKKEQDPTFAPVILGQSTGPSNIEDLTKLLEQVVFNPLQFATAAAAPSTSSEAKLYFDLLHLHPIKLNVSVYSQFADESGRTDKSQTVRFSSNTGIPVINLEAAPLHLDSLLMEHVYLDGGELILRLAAHYKRQGLQEIYKLIGSVEFLGAPTSLVSNIGTGVISLFYEPAKGIVQSPQDFGKGLATGVSSLVKHSVYAVFNTFSTVTGSAAKGLQSVANDPEFQWSHQQNARRWGRAAARQMSHEHPGRGQLNNIRTSVVDGVIDLGSGLFGVTDIIIKPYEGAMQDGAKGFVIGLGVGTVGTFVKPVAGFLQLVSKTTGGVRGLAQIHNSKPMARIRTPRVIPAQGAPEVNEWTGEEMGYALSSTRLSSELSHLHESHAMTNLEKYNVGSMKSNQTKLLILDMLTKIRNEKYASDELHEFFFVGAKVLLITDRRFLYVHKITRRVDWAVNIDRIVRIASNKEEIHIISFAKHAIGQKAWLRWKESNDLLDSVALGPLDRFMLQSRQMWCPTQDLQKKILINLSLIMQSFKQNAIIDVEGIDEMESSHTRTESDGEDVEDESVSADEENKEDSPTRNEATATDDVSQLDHRKDERSNFYNNLDYTELPIC